MAQSHEGGTDVTFFFHVFTWVRISFAKVIPHFQFVLSEFSAASAERHQYDMAIYVNDHPLRVIQSTLLNLVREKTVTSSQKR